ncbi:MAG TPA: hypothetical protein VMH81_16025 [Bryobacteraceae bacterium]|nr:hypothetical protein [Bryobacteraceae bacterium]
MQEALRIFRKDVRHLWPRLIPLLVVAALMGTVECVPFVVNPLLETLRGLWLLCAAFLTVSVIQQEALPGHRQYWLTRPFHRGHLFLGKALFLAAFAALPILIVEAVSVLVNGMPLWRHTPLLLVSTLVFTGGACALAAALASVTESLSHFLWGFLSSIGLVIVGAVLESRSGLAGGWGGLEWIRNLSVGVVVVGAALTVLLLQYARRKTAASRAILGAAILFAAAAPFMGSWHGAWTLETRQSGGPIDASAAHMAFDPSGRNVPGFADAARSPGPGQAGINLPVLLAGIPEGHQVVCEGISARIDAPGAVFRSAGWTRQGGLYRAVSLEDPDVIPADGPYWEYVNVDAGFYEAVKNTPVHVHTTVALTLLGARKSVPLATREQNSSSTGDGKCQVMPGFFGRLLVTCAWLGRAPARSYVTAVLATNGQRFTSLISAGDRGPFPLNGSVWWRDTTLFGPPPPTHEMNLETWEAVAHFERDLDVPQVRLADYAARRITDLP